MPIRTPPASTVEHASVTKAENVNRNKTVFVRMIYLLERLLAKMILKPPLCESYLACKRA
jgi:hypothetical protein